MFINDSDLKRVMTKYCKRLLTDRKSVAYYELLGAIEVLKHAGLIGNEDYEQLIMFDRMLAAACENGVFRVTDAKEDE